MKNFIEIDDERFVQLCANIQEQLEEVRELKVWSFINSLGLKPYKDGNQWCFLYGNNIQDGIAGFGNTILQAAVNFYEEMRQL